MYYKEESVCVCMHEMNVFECVNCLYISSFTSLFTNKLTFFCCCFFPSLQVLKSLAWLWNSVLRPSFPHVCVYRLGQLHSLPWYKRKMAAINILAFGKVADLYVQGSVWQLLQHSWLVNISFLTGLLQRTDFTFSALQTKTFFKWNLWPFKCYVVLSESPQIT